MNRICPKCGAASDKAHFQGSFCINCYMKDHPALVKVPREIELTKCPACGLVRQQQLTHDMIDSLVKAKIRTSLTNPQLTTEVVSENDKIMCLDVEVSGTLGNDEVKSSHAINLRFIKNQCEVCSKLQGKYHEAKFQIRFRDKQKDDYALNHIVDFIRREAERLSDKYTKLGIFRAERTKDGADIYLGDAAGAKKLVKRLGDAYKPEVTVSHTLKGLDSHTGKETFTTTYCLRFE